MYIKNLSDGSETTEAYPTKEKYDEISQQIAAAASELILLGKGNSEAIKVNSIPSLKYCFPGDSYAKTDVSKKNAGLNLPDGSEMVTVIDGQNSDSAGKCRVISVNTIAPPSESADCLFVSFYVPECGDELFPLPESFECWGQIALPDVLTN